GHQDRRQGGHPLHHDIQAVRDDREMRLEQAGELIAIEIDAVQHSHDVVVDVLEVHQHLLTQNRIVPPDQHVQNVPLRGERSAEIQELLLQDEDLGQIVAWPGVENGVLNRLDSLRTVVNRR